ncbi:MAG: hypothetical protein Q607_CBUC00180G0005 [Clostridium butyricum DORA_1]|nr:MAG: hypothetical protein Q607_CBUC00180G0005 [Clostridium butyricum DORA_1]
MKTSNLMNIVEQLLNIMEIKKILQFQVSLME